MILPLQKNNDLAVVAFAETFMYRYLAAEKKSF